MSRNVVRVLLLVALFSFAHMAFAQCPFNDPVMQNIEAPTLSKVPVGPGGQVSGKVNEKSGFGKKIEFWRFEKRCSSSGDRPSSGRLEGKLCRCTRST
jgi:hypothetical protein